MGATFNLVITGRRGFVPVIDQKTGNWTRAEDSSPQVMQYLDKRHAYTESFRLEGLRQANPNAVVEVRPPGLADDVAGQKVALSAWIKQCATSPTPAPSEAAPSKEVFVSKIDELAAEVADLKAHEVPAK